MVRQEGPGVHGPGPRLGQGRHAGDEVFTVGIVPEDHAAFEPPHHHVVEGPVEDSGRSAEGIQAGLAGHGEE